MRVGDMGLIKRYHPDQGKSSFYRKFIGPRTMNAEYESRDRGVQKNCLLDNWTHNQMGNINEWVGLGLPSEFFHAQG